MRRGEVDPLAALVERERLEHRHVHDDVREIHLRTAGVGTLKAETGGAHRTFQGITRERALAGDDPDRTPLDAAQLSAARRLDEAHVAGSRSDRQLDTRV